MSKSQASSVYKRDIVWVQQHPLKVGMHRLGSDQFATAPWLLSSVVTAVTQVGPDDLCHAAVRRDSFVFDFQPTKLALEFMPRPPDTVVELEPDDFDAFVRDYVMGVNNPKALKTVVKAIEQYAPKMRFMPPHLHYLLDAADAAGNAAQNGYHHLPRMFLRNDFRPYEALVWINRQMGQISPKRFPELQINPDNVTHIGGAWYAFKSLEEAVTTKFFAPQTEIHRLREDL